MSQELIDAANNLKAAAEKLLALAQKPAPTTIDFEHMSDANKEALRLLINPWLEYEYKRRLDEIGEKVDEQIAKALEGYPDADEMKTAMGEAEDASSKVENYPDSDDLERAVKKCDNLPDVDDIAIAIEKCDALPETDDIMMTVDTVKQMPEAKQVNEAVDIALSLPDVDKIVTVDMIAKFLDQVVTKVTVVEVPQAKAS